MQATEKRVPSGRKERRARGADVERLDGGKERHHDDRRGPVRSVWPGCGVTD